MNGKHFTYEDSREDPPRASSMNTTVLNALIYEYLIKKNYTGTAKVFKIEGDVNGINISSGTSALLDWFVAFNDVYNVRCGRGGSSGIVSKIDAVLGKGRPQEHEGPHKMGDPYRMDDRERFASGRYRKMVEYQKTQGYQGLVEGGRRAIPRSTSAEHVQRYSRDGDLLNTILGIPDEEAPFRPCLGLGDPGLAGLQPMSTGMPSAMGIRGGAASGIKPLQEGGGMPQPGMPKKPPMHFAHASRYMHAPMTPQVPGYQMHGHQSLLHEKEGAPAHSLLIKELTKLRLHTQKVTSVSICREKKALITGGADAFICVVDLTTFLHTLRFEAHSMQISQVKVREAASPMGEDSPTLFGSASLDTDVKIYKLERDEGSWNVSVLLHLKGHTCSVRGIDFGETKIFSMGIDGELRVWNMEGACLSVFSLRRAIRMISAKSDRVIAISDINSAFLFDLDSGTCLKEIAARGAICSYKMKNGSLLVFSDAVVLYDSQYKMIESVPFPADKIQSACFVAGRVFLGGYQTIYEWLDKRLSIIHAHDNIVTCLDSVEIAGKTLLISASYDGEVKIWEQFIP